MAGDGALRQGGRLTLTAALAIVAGLVLALIVAHGAWTARRANPRQAQPSAPIERTEPTLAQAADEPVAVPAVDEAAAFRPDLALLDIGMPRLNGYDVARFIRHQRWGKEIVLVALTGWGQEEDKRKAAEAGFDHHFTKPVSPGDIANLMTQLRAASAPQDKSAAAR